MYCDIQVGVEIIFIGDFIVDWCQFRIGFQLFGYDCCVVENSVDMVILQIQFCVLIVVIWYGGDFLMFIYDEFLVCCIVLYVDFFVFQLINVGVFVLLIYEQCGVVVIWCGKQYLFFMFWCDIYFCYYSVEVVEFQVGDQVVECLIGKGIGGVDFFIQCVGQVDVKVDNFVISIY